MAGQQLDARPPPDEAEVVPAGAAFEQIALQGKRANDAAPHAQQDGRKIVGAENGGHDGEFRDGDADWGSCGNVTAVGEEGKHDLGLVRGWLVLPDLWVW